MRKMTQANQAAAFAGESQAHMKYLAFADKADKEGFPKVARLFRATAYAEQVHATNHLKSLQGVGKTSDNLGAAIGGETHEVEEMYPAFMAVAKLQEEKQALRFNEWAMEAEKIHAVLYGKAKKAVEAGQDIAEGHIYVCSACGWTGEGAEPDECPLCGAKKDKFVTF